jgi:hypothetical protein
MKVAVPTLELSKYSIKNAIKEACNLTNSRWGSKGKADFVKFRLGDINDVSKLKDSMTMFVDFQHDEPDNLLRDVDVKLYLIIVEDFTANVIGHVALYWTYSSWDGRYIYVKNLKADRDYIELSLIYTLAEISLRCEGRRIVWQVK